MSTRLERRTIGKSASYTVSPAVDKAGAEFTTDGGTGAQVFTLPTPNAALLGVWYRFRNVVDQNMTVTAAAGKAVALNNTAATSLAATTGGQKIGACIEAHCASVGGVYKWMLNGLNNGITYTVA
jgi:hypothetical protein